MRRSGGPQALLALIGVLATRAGFTQLPESLDVSWADAAALERGDVVLQLRRDGRVTFVDAAILVDASPEEIWNILVACDIAPDYVPNVVACRSIDRINDGASELFIQTVKPVFFVPSFEHVFRMDYRPFERIDIHRVSGPIRQLDAIWWLRTRSDGKVLLVYALALDPGMPIPRVFVRATLRRDLPHVLEAISVRATAGPQ